jgi:hypothetical protein
MPTRAQHPSRHDGGQIVGGQARAASATPVDAGTRPCQARTPPLGPQRQRPLADGRRAPLPLGIRIQLQG